MLSVSVYQYIRWKRLSFTILALWWNRVVYKLSSTVFDDVLLSKAKLGWCHWYDFLFRGASSNKIPSTKQQIAKIQICQFIPHPIRFTGYFTSSSVTWKENCTRMQWNTPRCALSDQMLDYQLYQEYCGSTLVLHDTLYKLVSNISTEKLFETLLSLLQDTRWKERTRTRFKVLREALIIRHKEDTHVPLRTGSFTVHKWCDIDC